MTALVSIPPVVYTSIYLFILSAGLVWLVFRAVEDLK